MNAICSWFGITTQAHYQMKRRLATRHDTNAQVVDMSGEVIPGLYAAGETVGIYYGRYPGATSVLRGAVFGRLAGMHAGGANTTG